MEKEKRMDKQEIIHVLDIMLYEAEQEQEDITVCSHLSTEAKVIALKEAISFIMNCMM